MLFDLEDEEKINQKSNAAESAFTSTPTFLSNESLHEPKQTLPSKTDLEFAMTKEEKKILVNELTVQIRLHQEHYYNADPQISDDEFDALWDRLRVLDINNPIFRRVGEDADRESFFKKHRHLMPMGSLDKAADEDAFFEWYKKHEGEEYVVQHKLDGASLELQYRKGLLIAAVTRGDGKQGDNIIINARKMKGVVKRLDRPLDIAVRGEVIMTHHVHENNFLDKANCRNAANGLMKRKDGYQVEMLEVHCYDLWNINGAQDLSEKEKLNLLKSLGFIVVPFRICKSKEEINGYRNSTIAERHLLDYDIDGLVVKMPLAEAGDMASLRPDRQIAYKFPLESAQTKVLDIEWSESGHLYTPVAILEPVRIAGTLVKRASAVNPAHLEEMGISIGAEVLVVKRGEIIPKIEKVVVPTQDKNISIPSECSTCGTGLENTGTKLCCPNVRCRRRLLFRVTRWCNLLDVDYWGVTLLHRLVMEEKMINRVGDIYRINKDMLIGLDRIGKDLASKLLLSLHSRKTMDFSVFIAAQGIEGVAMLTAEKLVEAGYDDYESLCAANIVELSKIDNIGEIIARNVVDTLILLKDEIDDLLSYVEILPSGVGSGTAGSDMGASEHLKAPLKGKHFCFTGALSMSRKDAQSLVKLCGGQVKSSITKDLDYLVSADMNAISDKFRKAETLGIQIISEEEFVVLTKNANV